MIFGDTPKKHANLEDEVVDLGEYYFKKTHLGVMRSNPNGRKVDKVGQEITTSQSQDPKMVWKIEN